MFKYSVYKQEKGIVNLELINWQKIFVGTELLHVAQIDNDVKKCFCKILVDKSCVYFNHV